MEHNDRLGSIAATTPHLEARWAEAFVLEMRLLDVAGDRIGDELATVDAHCAESGETAIEAFGEPRTYAHSLAPTASGMAALRPQTTIGIALGMLGLLALPGAVSAWFAEQPVGITGGDIAAGAVVILLGLSVALRPSSVLRPLLGSRVAPWLTGAGLLVALSLPHLLWRGVLVEVPWPAQAVAGIALLTVSTVLTWTDLAGPTDPVRDPRTSDTGARPGAWVTALMFPILGALVTGMFLLIGFLG